VEKKVNPIENDTGFGREAETSKRLDKLIERLEKAKEVIKKVQTKLEEDSENNPKNEN
jgi:hypothetical protein